jgi:hypothetical protein
MRPQAEVDLALRLVRWGMNDCEIGRLTGIPRGTIRDWRHHGGRPSTTRGGKPTDCPVCDDNALLDRRRYAYLLGLYLGDGCCPSTRARSLGFVSFSMRSTCTQRSLPST